MYLGFALECLCTFQVALVSHFVEDDADVMLEAPDAILRF
jgi:hypothetical protein